MKPESDVNDLPLVDCIVELDKNYRFGEKSGIGKLASAVRKGDAKTAVEILETGYQDLEWIEPGRSYLRAEESIEKLIKEGFGEGFTGLDPVTALERLDRFRILCAVRKGPAGIERVNELAEDILLRNSDVQIRRGFSFYDGKPVMITKNDYNLEIFNGDTGIILSDPERNGRLSAWFSGPAGSVEKFAVSVLPEHITAYAMTIHKSQGSEFDHVAIILPGKMSALMTRELLYTAITRAVRKATIVADADILKATVESRVKRFTGLGDRLRGK